MARYIDADEAIKVIKEIVDNCDSRFYGEGLIDAQSEILAIPTADVAEVKHGEWISLTDCANAGVYCSVCHKKVYKEDYAWCNRKNKLRSDYCPNCGAKMDGGKEE